MATHVNTDLSVRQPAFSQSRQRIEEDSQARKPERTQENRAQDARNEQRVERASEEREAAQARGRDSQLLGRRIDVQA